MMVSGHKRNLVGDCLGLALAGLVTPTSPTDRNAACDLFTSLHACFGTLQLN